jgi:hypothetical protein
LIFQSPDGIIFPDRATMYMVGIEDRDYKEDKVECEYSVSSMKIFFYLIKRVVECLWIQYGLFKKLCYA